MPNLQRLRHKFLLREAEGYLELLSLDEQALKLDVGLRRPLVERVFARLGSLERLGRYDANVAKFKGEACRQLERYDEAIGYLRRAVELTPDDVSVYLALGWCYKRTERLDLAIEVLEAAMAMDQEEGTVHYNLGCYWSLAKNVKLAVRFLASAIELDPRFRELASHESDFDPIRESSEFRAVLSAAALSRAAD